MRKDLKAKDPCWVRFGCYLRQVRKDVLHLSQLDLACAAGVSKKTLGRLEKGTKVYGAHLCQIKKAVEERWKPAFGNLEWPSLRSESPPPQQIELAVSPQYNYLAETPSSGFPSSKYNYGKPPILEVIYGARTAAKEESPHGFTEGAWPLHQTLDDPFDKIMEVIDAALDRGDVDAAFPEFRRTLFYTGYHELWQIRRRLSEKFLRRKLGTRDLGWVELKAMAYLEMETGNYTRAKASILRAQGHYRHGNLPEGIGMCFLYSSDLYAKFGEVNKAVEANIEATKRLTGIPKLESQLSLDLLKFQHFMDPSSKKLKGLTTLTERFREVKSWRYALAELEEAKTNRALGNPQDALTVARRVELDFRTKITMERTRKLAVRLIEDIQSCSG